MIEVNVVGFHSFCAIISDYSYSRSIIELFVWRRKTVSLVLSFDDLGCLLREVSVVLGEIMLACDRCIRR